MSVISIVLAGGPGAGKTTILEVLKTFPRKDNAHLIFLDEAASKILKTFPQLHQSSPELFQATILGAQLAMNQIVERGFDNVICISDRGVYDLWAYIDDRAKFCEITGFAPYLSLPTYDLVIYLESLDSFVGIANSLYLKENSIEQVREIEAKTRQAWESRVVAREFVVVPPCDLIRDKARLVAEAINKYLGREIFDLDKGEVNESD